MKKNDEDNDNPENNQDNENHHNDEENIANDDEDTAEIIIYADDNTPTTAAEDPIELEAKIQQDGDKVIDWFDKNDMVTSSDKTKLLINRINRIGYTN